MSTARSASDNFNAELGLRLRRIYSLDRRPTNPDDFFQLLKAESGKHSGTRKFLESVTSGKAVIGGCDWTTKDWILTDGGSKIYTRCSYDILMTALLRGNAAIGSACPHCGEAMAIRVEGGRLDSFEPRRMVFFWGCAPDGAPGNPMCDHLHLFPNVEHMAAWTHSKDDEMGFSFKIRDAVRLLKSRF